MIDLTSGGGGNGAGSSRKPDLDALSAALAELAERWVPVEFPKGRREGDDWCLGNIKGAAPGKSGSTKIHLTGPKAAWWYEHDGGRGGQPLSTLTEGFGVRGKALIEKAEEIIARHGGSLADIERKALKSNGGNGSYRSESERHIQEAEWGWSQAQPLPGTPAEAYLAARHVWLAGSGLPEGVDPADLGFAENLTDWATRTGKPALVCRLRRLDGTATGGIHRIWLKPDGSWHVGGSKAKTTLGPAGLVMLGAPSAASEIGIAEGLETALAVWRLFGISCWAAISTSGMRSAAEQLRAGSAVAGSPQRLLVFADAGKPGLSAAEALAEAARSAGLQAEVRLPSGGDDFADDLARSLSPKPDTPRQAEWRSAAADESSRQPLSSPIGEGEASALSPPAEPQLSPPLLLPPAQASTEAELLAATRTLGRGADADTAAMGALLRRLAEAQLGELTEARVIEAVRLTTRLPVKVLRGALTQAKREAGILPASGGATQRLLPAHIETLLRRYVLVKKLNSFIDRATHEIYSIDSIRHAHWSEMPPNEEGAPCDPKEVLITGYRSYGKTVDKTDTIGFLPQASEIFEEDGKLKFNVWQCPTLLPVKGYVQPFLDHIWYLFDGEYEPMNWFLDWLAHLVQFPHIKMLTACLLVGEEGIGKSVLVKFMRRLLGERNVTALEASNLSSSFNEWMDGKQLVTINELMTIGRLETHNRLKGYITDDTLLINRKNVSSYEYRNRANFLMFSNHTDAAPIQKGDRRYFVWISNAKAKSGEYYQNLIDDWFYRNGGDAFLLDWMLSRDLSKFKPNAHAPDTQAKRLVVSDNRSEVDAFLTDAFEAIEAPLQHDLVVVNDIIVFLSEKRNIRTNHKVVSMFLRSIGAENLGDKRISDYRKPKVWAIRRMAEWAELTENEIRIAFREPGEGRRTYAEINQALGRSADQAITATDPLAADGTAAEPRQNRGNVDLTG